MRCELIFMKVLSSDGFAVYIYDDEHPPPHCHVIFSNSDEVVVKLPLLTGMYGKGVDKKIKKFLLNNLDTLLSVWDSKHPKNEN